MVYSCEEFYNGWVHLDNLWILSREPTMEDRKFATVVDYIEDVLPRYDVQSHTAMTYQGDSCMYRTMPETPDPQRNPLLP